VSYGRIADSAGTERRRVIRLMGEMVAQEVLLHEDINGRRKVCGVVKDYQRWQSGDNRTTSNGGRIDTIRAPDTYLTQRHERRCRLPP
jgi:hypothetical protein